MPSVDGDVAKLSAAQKDQVIGRQRDSFGLAMGDISLPAGDSVTKRVRLLVEQALTKNGYQVSADANGPNSVAVSVNKFWTWNSPGFWTLKFDARLTGTVTVNNADGGPHTFVVSGYGHSLGQVAKNANWQEAFQLAFDDFVTNLSSELNKIGLRDDNKARASADVKAGEQTDIYEQLKKLR